MSKSDSKPAPTVELLRELFNYDPETGKLTWRISRTHKTYPGMAAGNKEKSGRTRVRVGYRQVFVHRIAWALYHGVWPEQIIDHINGDPSDNRICNLRDVSRQVNQQNFRKPNKNNKTGFLGVSAVQGHFYAKVHTSGVNYFIGSFKTPEQASEAYLEAKRQLHIGCTL